MNEEFATLKDMIPACRGQEMHKLAILQVSLFIRDRKSDILILIVNIGKHRLHELPRRMHH